LDDFEPMRRELDESSMPLIDNSIPLLSHLLKDERDSFLSFPTKLLTKIQLNLKKDVNNDDKDGSKCDKKAQDDDDDDISTRSPLSILFNLSNDQLLEMSLKNFLFAQNGFSVFFVC